MPLMRACLKGHLVTDSIAIVTSLSVAHSYSAAMIRMSLLLLALAHPAYSQGMTQDDVLQGQFRTGWQSKGGSHMAALHLRLAQNWKTYWRAPGDAGIPPSFDWTGSTNLKSVTLHWPSPEVFQTNGLTTVGYHHELVLPIEVHPIDPSKPVHLEATVHLGVCEDICMPAELDLTADLTLPGAPDPVIKQALAARPVTAKQAGVKSHDCTVEPINDGMRLTTRIDLPRKGRTEMVVVETGQTGVWVSQADVQQTRDGLVATVDMVPPSGQPFALTRDQVVVTVIGPARTAVELIGCPSP